MCHPSHDDEQHQQAATLQRQDQQQESNTEQRQKYMSGTYKYLVVHFTAVYKTFIIYQVQVPCCEATRDTQKKMQKTIYTKSKKGKHSGNQTSDRILSQRSNYLLDIRCIA